jgi:hypothetical protein
MFLSDFRAAKHLDIQNEAKLRQKVRARAHSDEILDYCSDFSRTMCLTEFQEYHVRIHFHLSTKQGSSTSGPLAVPGGGPRGSASGRSSGSIPSSPAVGSLKSPAFLGAMGDLRLSDELETFKCVEFPRFCPASPPHSLPLICNSDLQSTSYGRRIAPALYRVGTSHF